MSYFPMFVELEGRQCLIVGGGDVAFRKAKALMDFGAKVLLVSPEISPEIRAMEGISYIQRPFEKEDADSRAFVIAATGDALLNREIARICREKNIPVNAVDQIKDSSFIFPAYLKEGDVVAAFSSGGKSPVLAQHLKERMRPVFSPMLGEMAECLGSHRRAVQRRIKAGEARKRVYLEILQKGLEENQLPSESEIEEIIKKYGG